MNTRPRLDPWRRFNFILEIDGKVVAGFLEATGLITDVDAIDDRDAPASAPRLRPHSGVHEVGRVTLKRGAANRKAFFEWQAAAVASRHGATIVLIDAGQRPVLRWRLAGAWPNKIEGPTLSASANDVAIESLELTHEGLTAEA